MARKETQKLGSIPLHTLEANVDYAVATSRTTYGAIGIKVWIYKGKFGEENEQPYRRHRRSPRRMGSGQAEKTRHKTATRKTPVSSKENVVENPPVEPGRDESNPDQSS